jgi:hypothetical protein
MAKKPLKDKIAMEVVGNVVFVREFAKGVHVRVQAEVKDGVQITQGVTIWDNEGDERPQVGEGDRVYAEGYPKINTYEGKDGLKSTIDCVARKFEVLSSASDDDEI